ncbi:MULTISPECIES: DUF2285 domain-containing protein [unclassified Mesorhizobium]|uniref:DUF2285 domain-containing protein n=1 Tax=unclassified Mesorhizobium TaxID=325217 RepID=UPI00112A3B9F|nr:MULTISPECIES: DUF2285 domain-containing protein [unclassified Mesorhizobium]TPK95296.1 DUF2285 domain-containing protein [Mesorhizobium sp. B2-4-16]TPL60991.1 DUF2285 domain-containing protein [Mesorhizobium sp. B2-4-3]
MPLDGARDFTVVGDKPLSSKHIVWTEQASPRILRATKLPASTDTFLPGVQAANLDGASTWTEADHVHILWQPAREVHQVVASKSDTSHGMNALILPLDENFETRLDAARRFWRALNGRPPSRGYGSLPQQTKLRHILNLRAHDGRAARATYRRIAEVLLSPEPITPRDWRDHHLRHKVRAILHRADRLVAGGYRDLLLYPQSRGRKSDI